jgi:uncharacterized protein YdhG (YjbR/CyaY superfamily)
MSDKPTKAFSDVEVAAMKERAKEQKAQARRGSKSADLEAELLAKIAEMPDEDRVMGERIHAIVRATAPDLTPKLWYGQPAYARDGKVVLFFQASQKFKTRYSTLGFSEDARLDDGKMWPTSYALLELTPAEEARIVELVKQAAG